MMLRRKVWRFGRQEWRPGNWEGDGMMDARESDETLTNNSFRYVLKAICTIKEVSNDKLGEIIAILSVVRTHETTAYFITPLPIQQDQYPKHSTLSGSTVRQFSTSECHCSFLLDGTSRRSSTFKRVELEEAKECSFGVQQAWEQGLRKIILEGDCSSIIFNLASRFDFYFFSHVKRMQSRVFHLQNENDMTRPIGKLAKQAESVLMQVDSVLMLSSFIFRGG
ncbi:hypothetical protein Cgig2_023667 [Carnegiea gigantea]|uniref:RNase H type-1 domain-containing protein n=1 Tax=Carnegiea gigantea TaxID=171969 RepID=A0A9Q1KJE2_9CARY|nr:hypothetical protein Cgig2_023667 [Carnegiea gigantea]